MYSYEIDAIMKQNNYDIDANTYDKICRTSPQLNHIKYDAFTDSFEVWDDDGAHWSFKVHR